MELQGERRTQILPRYLESDFKQNLAEQQSDIDDAMMKDIVKDKRLLRECPRLEGSKPHKKAEFLESLKLAMSAQQVKYASCNGATGNSRSEGYGRAKPTIYSLRS